jgi:hypothetical protein
VCGDDGGGSSDGSNGSDGGSGADLLFASGWDNTTDLGCTFTGLIDNAWDDYGGSTACSGDVHDADVVDDIHHDGARALRVTQKPGGINGTDFRIGKQFGTQAEVTILGWVYYAPNYHWADADHKIFITMDNVPMAQNVYINYRGGSDPQHARLCAGIIPVDTIMCADSPQVTVGTWYRIRAHVVAGTHGKVEIWLQPEGQAEVKLHLVNDPDAVQIDIDDVDTGVLGGFKYDSTYNDGSSVTELMYQYVDSIEVHSGLFGGP